VGGSPRSEAYPTPGLYHVGFKVGNSDDELREAIADLQSHGVEVVGSANHHVTHSVYILDPDNNEIELYIDVDDSWKNDKSKIIKRPEILNL
jgi:catechol-2,3-dioxygenase